MFAPMTDLLVRARVADIHRGFGRPVKRRSSLRIALEARRSRRQGPAG